MTRPPMAHRPDRWALARRVGWWALVLLLVLVFMVAWLAVDEDQLMVWRVVG